MASFDSVLVEGVFYDQDGRLLAKWDKNPEPTDVVSALTPILNRLVTITVHHWPPTPIEQDRWGGGCCLWQPAGKCPAGHHENPGFILNVSGTGVLRNSEGKWWVEKDDGQIETLPLDLMAGHHGRIVAVTILDMDSLTEKFDFDPASVSTEDSINRAATLAQQAAAMRDLMGSFTGFLKTVKGE